MSLGLLSIYMTVKLKGMPSNISIAVVYVPTAQCTVDDTDKF